MPKPHNHPNPQLPQPTTEAIIHSQRLVAAIKHQINSTHGMITFADYMNSALYAPGQGYYSAGSQKFGPTGDFVTAPEISPLFGRALARQCEEILKIETINNNGTILEFGAGTGILAATLLLELEQLKSLPTNYFILEISADLQQRQQQTLQQQCQHLLPRVHWLEKLPSTAISGVILANEIMDAMPVNRFLIENNIIFEYYVACNDDAFTWKIGVPSTIAFKDAVKKIHENYLPHAQYYSSEINLALPAWINGLSNCLQQGLILLIDYGFPRAEYYHPDRADGTLMCHYRHHAHADPFYWPGLQDITAHVDFTLVAEAATIENLSVCGYASQGGFLLGCGIVDCLQQASASASSVEQFQLQQQLKKLTLPNEMGELFKVIGLSRNLDKKLRGFSMQDRRGSL